MLNTQNQVEIIEVRLYDESLSVKLSELKDVGGFPSNLECIFIPKSDYGFAEIYKIYGDFFVFAIPQYGGQPEFYKSFSKWQIKDLIKDLKSIV